MTAKARRAPAHHVDALFFSEYRDHAGRSHVCMCSSDGPGERCDVGGALWRVAHQASWEERKRAINDTGRL